MPREKPTRAWRGKQTQVTTLYVSDLDGTLLTNTARLSDYSRSVLQALLADGLKFSVASARSVASMRNMLHGLTLELPVIEFNGAFLSDLRTGHHAVVNALEPQIARAIFASISRRGRTPLISTFNGRHDCLYHDEPANEGTRWYVSDRQAHRDPRLRRSTDLREALHDQVVCLTVIDRAELLIDLEAQMTEQYGELVETHLFENAYSPGWYWLTIHDRRATKDQAIGWLMENCGLHGDELIVFGDQINDITMFRMAAQAVAVANAHPDVKRHATHFIGSNEEDSVVKYIRDHRAQSMSR